MSDDMMFNDIANAGSLMPRSSVNNEMEKLFTDTIVYLDRNDWTQTKPPEGEKETNSNSNNNTTLNRKVASRHASHFIDLLSQPSNHDHDYAPSFGDVGMCSTLRTSRSMREMMPPPDVKSIQSCAISAERSHYGPETGMERRETLMESQDANLDLGAPLPKPFSGGCLSISALKYYVKSCLAKNPRLYALYLFLFTITSKILVMFDMFTDFLVAYELYRAGEQWWFMLSSLFIAFPFVLVWNASLRWLQYQMENSKFIDKRKSKPFARMMINIVFILYMFPPFGSALIVLAEIYWVFMDIVEGVNSFVRGYSIIDRANRQKSALKTYRRAIEIFAESIPQTLLQLYIFLMARFGTNTSAAIQSVPIEDLVLSLSTSVLNLSFNFFQFWRESKVHGMLMSEYALSVLQLAEVPIAKFVPRLPAIKQGMVERVNFGGFKFDKASVTPLLEAINSDRCRLHTIKLSVGSLHNLELNTCKMLGYWLKQKELKVLISRVSSLREVKKLFKKFDDDGNGFLDEEEFLAAIQQFKCPLSLRHIKRQKRVFQEMAIRRPRKRDRIYFYDLFLQTADPNAMDNEDQEDLTQIMFPIHFIFKNLKYTMDQLVETQHPLNDKMEKRLMSDMSQLFYFCQGLGHQNDLDDAGNSVLFAVIEASYAMDALPREHRENAIKYEKLLWIFLLRLLETPISMYDAAFYLNRNHVFAIRSRSSVSLHDEESDKLLRAKAFIHDLEDKDGRSGYNCFEYCFLYEDERMAKCRHFVYILDTFLQTVHAEGLEGEGTGSNFLSELLDAPLPADQQAARPHLGELYRLFKGTNGFHVKDANGFTPLYYAVKFGKLYAVWFFVTHVMERKHLEESDAHRLNPCPRAKQFRMKRRSIFNRTQRPSQLAFLVPTTSQHTITQAIPAMTPSDEMSLQSEDLIEMSWLKDQNYLHLILYAALSTKDEHPTTQILHCLLSSDKFDINHCLKRKETALGTAATILSEARRSILDPPEQYIGHEILKLRSRMNGDAQHLPQDRYLLQCLVVLKQYGYAMLNATEKTKNTLMHQAAMIGDKDVFDVLVEVYEQQKWTLSMENIGTDGPQQRFQDNDSGFNAKRVFLRSVEDVERELTALLNAKNAAGKTALDIAMEHEWMDIAEILLDTDEQKMDISRLEDNNYYSEIKQTEAEEAVESRLSFVDERKRDDDERWLQSFTQLVVNSEGELLSRFDQRTKRLLLQHFNDILGDIDRGNTDQTPIASTGNGQDSAGLKVSSPRLEMKVTEEDNPTLYRNLKVIIEYLHKDMGIPMRISKGCTAKTKAAKTQFQLKL